VDLLQQIRNLALSGVPKFEVAHRFGFTPSQFEKVCAVIDGIHWSRRNGGFRGTPSPVVMEKLKANIAKARNVKVAKSRRTVRGITGTVEELCAHFDVSLAPVTIRKRVADGMSLEQALFSGKRGAPRVRDWSNVVFPTTDRTFVHQRQ
jgi:hypothetical protein